MKATNGQTSLRAVRFHYAVYSFDDRIPLWSSMSWNSKSLSCFVRLYNLTGALTKRLHLRPIGKKSCGPFYQTSAHFLVKETIGTSLRIRDKRCVVKCSRSREITLFTKKSPSAVFSERSLDSISTETFSKQVPVLYRACALVITT